MAMMTPPEHRARTRRWGRQDKKRNDQRRRRRRRAKEEESAARDAAWKKERAAAEIDHDGDDTEVEEVVPAASPSPKRKKLRLLHPSQIGEVFGSHSRVGESVEVEDEDGDATPDYAVAAPTSPVSTPATPGRNFVNDKGEILFAPGAAAPAQGVTAPSFLTPSAAAASTTPAVVVIASLPSPPPPPPPCSSSSQQVHAPCYDKKPLPLITESVMPPLLPVAPPTTTICPMKRKLIVATHHHPQAAASSSRAIIAQSSPLPPRPPQQLPTDAFERRKYMLKKFSTLITKSQEAIDGRYREDLKNGRVARVPVPAPAPAPAPEPAPVPEPEPAPDKAVTRRRLAAIADQRRCFRVWLRRTEMKARRDMLFMQIAHPHHLKALGIDKAMELVVSPERPRDGDGEPVVSPEHPCSPVEKLGLFLKPL